MPNLIHQEEQMMNFAQKLATLRRARGETQEQLGKVLGISGKTVSKWEAAVREPDLGMLMAIGAHYGVSTDELLGLACPQSGMAMLKEELDAEPTAAAKFKRFSPIMMSLTRMMVNSIGREQGERCADAVPAPDEQYGDYRSVIQHPMGTLVCYNMRETQVAAQVWRNEADFAWLYDDRARMADYFAWLGDPDTLALLYVLERADFSADFTAAYAAEQAGIDAGKAESILEKMLGWRGYAKSSGVLSKSMLETPEGKCAVYTFHGCGTTMAILSLARAMVLGWNCNCTAYNDSGKMIGEEGHRG